MEVSTHEHFPTSENFSDFYKYLMVIEYNMQDVRLRFDTFTLTEKRPSSHIFDSNLETIYCC